MSMRAIFNSFSDGGAPDSGIQNSAGNTSSA